MAKRSDLMGLGLSYPLANVMADEPTVATVQGTSQGSAFQIGNSGINYVLATNSGNYANLPSVGGSGNSVLLGDGVIVANLTAGSIVVTASSGATINYAGAATTGTTGVSVSTLAVSEFWPISPSTWIGMRG